MPPRSELIAVFDPEDSLQSQQMLSRLHDPRRRRLVAEVMVGDRTMLALAQEMLAGLGKDLDLPGSDREGRTSWIQLVIWIEVLGIEDLFISRAHHLGQGGWRWLAELASVSQVRVWILSQVAELSRGQRGVLSQWPIKKITQDQFEEHWHKAAASTAGPADPNSKPESKGFPEVPEADFPFFRADCKASLSTADFAAIDQAFCVGLKAAAGDPTTADEVCTLVLDVAASAASLDEAITRVRGLQVGLFRRGWLLRTDLARCRVWLSQLLDTRHARGEGARLLGYAAPAWSCPAALALFEDLAPPELAALTVAELAAKAEAHRDQVVRDCCRAQVLLRFNEGAAPSDPAFEGHERAKTAGSARMVRVRLKKIAEDTGLPLIRQRHARSAGRAPELLARDSGFRVSPLQLVDDG